MWVKQEQKVLRNQDNFTKLEASLKLFEDNQGILRLRGRFAGSTLKYDEKYPIILRDSCSYFTKLVILDAHERVIHQGVESTLSYVRSTYWVLKGRKTVKDVLRKCVVCRRHQGKTNDTS